MTCLQANECRDGGSKKAHRKRTLVVQQSGVSVLVEDGGKQQVGHQRQKIRRANGTPESRGTPYPSVPVTSPSTSSQLTTVGGPRKNEEYIHKNILSYVYIRETPVQLGKQDDFVPR